MTYRGESWREEPRHVPSTQIAEIVVAVLAFGFAFFDVGDAALVIGLISSELGCEAAGGKWASSSNRCIDRGCFAANDCGIWAHAYWCKRKLAPGDPLSEVVFWLGEPDEIDGETYWWGEDKSSLKSFSATIHDGGLVALGDSVRRH